VALLLLLRCAQLWARGGRGGWTPIDLVFLLLLLLAHGERCGFECMALQDYILLIERRQRCNALFIESSKRAITTKTYRRAQARKILKVSRCEAARLGIGAYLVLSSLGLKDRKEDFSIGFAAFGCVGCKNLAHAGRYRLR
jgi:hypothetical protein